VGLGSNYRGPWGTPAHTIERALREIERANIVIRAIIIILGAQVSNSTIVVIIALEAEVGISASFSIVKALVVRIISASFIIVEVGSPHLLLLLLLRVDQLRRPVSRGEEEKQDQ